jgi:phosphoglycerate dehydrogenase-like enzyme
MPKVTVLDDYQGVAGGLMAELDLDGGYQVDAVREHVTPGDDLVDLLRNSDVVVLMRERTALDVSTLERLPALRLVVTTGMRNAALDVAAARSRGVAVSGTGGMANETAELTVGLLLSLARHITTEDRSLHNGGWQSTIGMSLAGSTVGLVGLGRQGARVSRLLRAFDTNLVAWSPHLTRERASEHGVTAVSRHEIFAGSDFVTIHLPLVDATRGLIGHDDLALMKSAAYLVNTSRGPIVDEAALVAALETRSIAGAGLDVYDKEPLSPDHRLRSAPNAILLPHLGYVTTDVYRRFFADVVDDIRAFYRGAPVRELRTD